MTELYTLKSIRDFVSALSGILDIAFPTNDLRVIVEEGSFTNDAPWRLTIAVTGELRSQFLDLDHIEVVINPQTFLDQVDHGGNVSKAEYTAVIFQRIMYRLLDKAKNPDAMVNEVNANMRKAGEARGIPMGEVTVGPPQDFKTDSGIILPS